MHGVFQECGNMYDELIICSPHCMQNGLMLNSNFNKRSEVALHFPVTVSAQMTQMRSILIRAKHLTN